METDSKDLLLLAANRCGSSQRLAAQLAVTHSMLRVWMRGEETPPAYVVARASALLGRPLGVARRNV
jgi:hypothetical protein